MPKEKILIVDDDPSILQLTQVVLIKEGYDVSAAKSAGIALRMLKKEKFDLMVTDIVMPRISGLELLRRARVIDPYLPAIIITGHGTIDLAIDSLKEGAQSFLLKPFGVHEISNTVKEALLKNRKTRDNMRLKALMPLLKLSKALVSEANLEKVFALTVEVVAHETRSDRVSLMLLSEDSKELAIKASVGLPLEIINSTQKMGGSISSYVIKTGTPLILNKDTEVSPALKRKMNQHETVSALCVPLRVSGRVIGVLSSSKTTENPFTQSDLELLTLLAEEAAIVIENVRLFSNIKAQQTRLEQLLKELLNAQENERWRISAEIHDGVMQWMVGASYRVQLCSALISESKLEESRIEVNHVQEYIDQSIKELRLIITDLRPPALSELGLEGAIKQNVLVLQKQTGIICHFNNGGGSQKLSAIQEITIYRIVQEALNNVWKHASATKVEVQLQFKPDAVSVNIKDNGQGFNLAKIDRSGKQAGKMGLLTMKERAEVLGGSLQIVTNQGTGTTVVMKIPLSSIES